MTARVPIDQRQLATLCRRHHVAKLAFFGSVLRDDFRPDSDVDVLVEFEPGWAVGFFRLHEVEQELSGLVGGRRVDLMTYKGLNPRIRERVLAQAETQFAA